MRGVRSLSVALLIAQLAGPALAGSVPHGGDCERMTRQIARYERDAKWADERGNQLWQDASNERVEQLTNRRDELCPQYRRPNPLVVFANWVAEAAKVAAPYFIPGLGL